MDERKRNLGSQESEAGRMMRTKPCHALFINHALGVSSLSPFAFLLACGSLSAQTVGPKITRRWKTWQLKRGARNQRRPLPAAERNRRRRDRLPKAARKNLRASLPTSAALRRRPVQQVKRAARRAPREEA